MAKRFNIPFKSLGNVSCRIEIWDKDYSGPIVELSEQNANAPGLPAADPVYIEEDSNEDLLQPLRSKTGYINLVEMTTDGLSMLRPLTCTQLTVYLYYDSELVFFGYIQAQSFGDELMQAPREMKIPICSPLALMSGQTFLADAGIGDRPIGEYMDECLAGRYQSVIFPKDVYTEGVGISTAFQLKVSDKIVSPYNDDYDFGIPVYGVTPSCYAPVHHDEFLTGVCHLFGLVCHEYGRSLIFTKYGYEGDYIRMTVGDLSTGDYSVIGSDIGGTVVNVSSEFSFGGVLNTEGIVLPISKVEENYGKFIDNVEMDLSRSVYVGNLSLQQFDFNGVLLSKQTQELMSSVYSAEMSPVSSNYVRILGDRSMNQLLEIVYQIPAGSSLDQEILTYTFTSVPMNITGGHIQSTFSGDVLRMQVYSGGKYYNTDHEWQSTPAFIPLVFDSDGNCTTYDIASNGHSITIKLFPNTNLVNGLIKEFTLKTFADERNRYRISDRNTRTFDCDAYNLDENESTETTTIDMMFHQFSGNDGYVTGGSIIRPSYKHVMTPQPRLRLEVKVTSDVDMELLYLYKLQAYGLSVYSRLLATEFHPWDDQYTLYIQGSLDSYVPPAPVLPYDAEVEYLESTGTQYIDTGYKNWTTSVYIYSEVAFTSTSGRQLEGAVNSFYVGCNAGRVEAMYTSYFGTIQADTKIILEKSIVKSGNNVTFTIKKDGYAGYTRTQAYTGNEITKNIAFFNLIDNTSLGMKCKKYANKLIIDGVLVRDYIPVRVGTTGYMYDKVSSTLFGNAGTGSFTLGPDKNNE